MGYTTDFDGAFSITPPLTAEQVAELKKFSDTRHSPNSDPSYYCQWVPTNNGANLVWDGGEKFYCYIEWLDVLINKFFRPWGRKLNGKVLWMGEERTDIGTITITDNHVSTSKGRVVWGGEED